MRTVLYIVEHTRFGSGDISGSLVESEAGVLHSHVSSSPTWLRLDLTQNFGRRGALTERYGDWHAVYVSVDDDVPDEIAHYFNDPDAAQKES